MELLLRGPDADELRVYGYPGDIGQPIPNQAETPLDLALVTPQSSCEPVTAPPPHDKITTSAALVSRGGCDFLTKAEHVAAAGYKAMILVEADDSRGCVYMSSNDTHAAHALPLHVATVSAVGGARIIERLTQGPVKVYLSAPPPRGHDWSALLLFTMAVGCLMVACALAARDAQRASGLSQEEELIASEQESALVLSRRAAALFIVIASTSLLLLYWLRGDWVVTVFSILFGVGAWQPLKHALEAAAAWLASMASPTRRMHTNLHAARLPDWLLGGVRLSSALAGAVSLALCLLWMLCRDARWDWALQNVLALAFLVSLLRGCLIPDLATATILLPLAFVYDVWWVFLQPLVTGGPSVMVEVAAGGGEGPRLPMVLLAPEPGPGDNPAMAVLGLGDVALPGLLAVLLARWDAIGPAKPGQRASVAQAMQRGYTAPVIVAFAVGLAVTYTALRLHWFGDAGQPALLYLVPCVLGTTCGLAALRGELRELWEADVDLASPGGKVSDEEGLDPRAALLAV